MLQVAVGASSCGAIFPAHVGVRRSHLGGDENGDEGEEEGHKVGACGCVGWRVQRTTQLLSESNSLASNILDFRDEFSSRTTNLY